MMFGNISNEMAAYEEQETEYRITISFLDGKILRLEKENSEIRAELIKVKRELAESNLDLLSMPHELRKIKRIIDGEKEQS